MSLWTRLILVGASGAVGAMLRFLVGLGALRLSPTAPYLGTLIVNIVGCFIFGAVAALADRTSVITPAMRLMILTGALGAFTTFSAYAHDTITLYGERGPYWAVGYVVGQNVLAFAAALLGLALGKAVPV